MSDELSKLLETQISLTEWLARVNHQDATEMREEDNTKRERSGELNKIIGLPYDKPATFEAIDITKRTKEFQKFLAEHGDELCALRLNPKKGSGAEKFRNRGRSIRGALEWFDGLDLDPIKYTADFVPHVKDNAWATIFVVNESSIFGEIYKGGHHVLTQGFDEYESPISFIFDFAKWTLSNSNKEALAYLKKLVVYLHVTDLSKQKLLKQKLKAEFTHNYLKGYFETTNSKSHGTWFIDYNRLLGKRYDSFVLQLSTSQQAILQGNVACGGKAAGKARIIKDPQAEDIEPGDILVCEMTSPDYIPLMVKAGGLITDHGGILCHAAIVARELNLPCIVGTQKATKVLKAGDKVELNLVTGEVSR